MPSEKKGKKATKIKSEPTETDEIHPLAHYVDDRLELIKQVFATLKSKTIKNFAPEFLSVCIITFLKSVN